MSEGDAAIGTKTLLLWGDTQSGKTTWLTTALMYADALQRLAMIDWEKSAAGLEESGIRKRWLDLRDNRQTQSTTGAWRVDLQLRSGNVFRIQDIRGGDVRQDAMRWFRVTDGLLGIVEWGSERLAQQLAAVEAILPLIGAKPKGLAITKCERWLPEDEAAWRGPAGWWRDYAPWSGYAHVLEAFGDRVWPTSAYGYDSEGRPACLLGEFGQVLPYKISPKNVSTPLLSFLREFQL